MNHYHWKTSLSRAGKIVWRREIYERMVIQRQAAAPYLRHYAERLPSPSGERELDMYVYIYKK